MNLVELYAIRPEIVQYYRLKTRETTKFDAECLRVHGRYIIDATGVGMTPYKIGRVMEQNTIVDYCYGFKFVLKNELAAKIALDCLIQYLIKRDYGD